MTHLVFLFLQFVNYTNNSKLIRTIEIAKTLVIIKPRFYPFDVHLYSDESIVAVPVWGKYIQYVQRLSLHLIKIYILFGF